MILNFIAQFLNSTPDVRQTGGSQNVELSEWMTLEKKCADETYSRYQKNCRLWRTIFIIYQDVYRFVILICHCSIFRMIGGMWSG